MYIYMYTYKHPQYVHSKKKSYIITWISFFIIKCYNMNNSMKLTVSASPLRAARSSGVRPCLSGWFRSAPASTRSCTTPFWPFIQAQLSVVSPSWSAEDREAPGTTNNTNVALQFFQSLAYIHYHCGKVGALTLWQEELDSAGVALRGS